MKPTECYGDPSFEAGIKAGVAGVPSASESRAPSPAPEKKATVPLEESVRKGEWWTEKKSDPEWLTFRGLTFGEPVSRLPECGTAPHVPACLYRTSTMGNRIRFEADVEGLDSYAEYLEDDGVLVRIKLTMLLPASRSANQLHGFIERFGEPDESSSYRWLWKRRGLRIEMLEADGKGRSRCVEVYPQAWFTARLATQDAAKKRAADTKAQEEATKALTRRERLKNL